MIGGVERRRYEAFRRWSDDPNGYATLQPGLAYQEQRGGGGDGGGYLAWRPALGSAVALNDPVAQPGRDVTLACDLMTQHPGAAFVNITEGFGQRLVAATQRRLLFAPIGTERILDLDRPGLRDRKEVRGARKKARKAGWRFEEARFARLDEATRRRLAQINDGFLRRSQAGRELPFIARLMVLDEEPDVRLFLMYHGDRGRPEQLFGFFTLDPWFRDDRLVGAQLNQVRFEPTRIWGVYLSIVHDLIDLLRAEGLEHLALGACALHEIELPHGLPSSLTHQLSLRGAQRLADRFHSMSNFTHMKLLFPGRSIRRFIAAPQRNPLVPLLRLLRAAHILALPGPPGGRQGR